ncbi:MAG: CheR family methyltransferase [Pseudomonadota bacterium]
MRAQDFELLARLLRERSGLVLTPEKTYLLESRLTPLARRNGYETLDRLIEEIRAKSDEELIREVTEAMTTNESFFFRDMTPFDNMKNHVLPMLRQKKAVDRRIRIWCAACSTGQEPYSLAMLLKENEAQWQGWRIEIIGTDIARNVLKKAQEGIYSQFEVQRGLPIQLMIKYFTQNGDLWQISKDLREMVTYKEFNLLSPFSGLGQFDVVFCRNVLIYFDPATKGEILRRLHGVMPVHGSLFLGAAETVIGITDKFKAVKGLRGLYVPTEAADTAPLAAASA